MRLGGVRRTANWSSRSTGMAAVRTKNRRLERSRSRSNHPLRIHSSPGMRAGGRPPASTRGDVLTARPDCSSSRSGVRARLNARAGSPTTGPSTGVEPSAAEWSGPRAPWIVREHRDSSPRWTAGPTAYPSKSPAINPHGPTTLGLSEPPGSPETQGNPRVPETSGDDPDPYGSSKGSWVRIPPARRRVLHERGA